MTGNLPKGYKSRKLQNMFLVQKKKITPNLYLYVDFIIEI